MNGVRRAEGFGLHRNRIRLARSKHTGCVPDEAGCASGIGRAYSEGLSTVAAHAAENAAAERGNAGRNATIERLIHNGRSDDRIADLRVGGERSLDTLGVVPYVGAELRQVGGIGIGVQLVDVTNGPEREHVRLVVCGQLLGEVRVRNGERNDAQLECSSVAVDRLYTKCGENTAGLEPVLGEAGLTHDQRRAAGTNTTHVVDKSSIILGVGALAPHVIDMEGEDQVLVLLHDLGSVGENGRGVGSGQLAAFGVVLNILAVVRSVDDDRVLGASPANAAGQVAVPRQPTRVDCAHAVVGVFARLVHEVEPHVRVVLVAGGHVGPPVAYCNLLGIRREGACRDVVRLDHRYGLAGREVTHDGVGVGVGHVTNGPGGSAVAGRVEAGDDAGRVHAPRLHGVHGADAGLRAGAVAPGEVETDRHKGVARGVEDLPVHHREVRPCGTGRSGRDDGQRPETQPGKGENRGKS